MQNLIHGLGALGTPQAVGYLFAGALIGMIIGVIPGLSTIVILSLMLVFINHIDLTGTLCLFLGAQCGSFYSASVSSILLNTPSHPEAFPVTLDGYPMARKGQPGRALGLSAASTCIGGLIGCGVLIGFLQIVNNIPNLFHPPEYVALVTLALLLVGTLGSNSIAKAVVSAGVGLVVASIGPSAITGTFRYTFGAVGLYAGVSLVALSLGLFAIPQMIMIFGTGKATARQDIAGREIDHSETVEIHGRYARELSGGVLEAFRHWSVLLQSGLIGGITGIIPGIGGFTGNFMAYGLARQTSRNRAKFGTGTPEGIIAPEGSSLAKEAGHIIPIIGLGIPGGAAGALFIGALTIKGLKLGYGFQQGYPNVSGEMVWIIAISGLIGTLAGVLIGPQLAKITRVPGPLIVPFIFALCVIGPFFTEVTFFAVVEMLVVGILGLTLRRLAYPLGPLILGLVLGPTLENNIYLTHTVYPGVSWIRERPLADAIFAVCIIFLISKTRELRKERVESQVKREEEIAVSEGETVERVEAQRERNRRVAPYPLLAPIVSTLLLVGAIYVIVVATGYGISAGTMPFIGGLCVIVPTAIYYARDLKYFVLYLQDRKVATAPVPSIVEDEIELEFASKGELLRSRSFSNYSKLSESTPLAATPVIRDRSFGPNGQYRREVTALAWLAGMVFLCWLIGFPITTPIFMAAYGLCNTKRHLPQLRSRLLYSAIAAAVMWVAVYEMFNLAHLAFTPVITL